MTELRFKNVTKRYGDKLALDHFNAVLFPGIYGLLGPNGAGKSTLMQLITDSISRTEGEILYNGTEILELGEAFRNVVGYLPQSQAVYDQFSAERFLYYIAGLKGMKKKQAREEIGQYLEMVGLYEKKQNKLGSFSGGMRQRVLFAAACIGNPEIIILDEPTAGLDPEERIKLRNYISELAENKIVILSTHIVSDIESIANKIILLKEGKLIAEKTPAELLTSVSGKLYETICDGKQMKQLMTEYKRGNISQREEGIVFRIVAEECPCGFVHSKATPDMEDVYLYYFE